MNAEFECGPDAFRSWLLAFLRVVVAEQKDVANPWADAPCDITSDNVQDAIDDLDPLCATRRGVYSDGANLYRVVYALLGVQSILFAPDINGDYCWVAMCCSS